MNNNTAVDSGGCHEKGEFVMMVRYTLPVALMQSLDACVHMDDDADSVGSLAARALEENEDDIGSFAARWLHSPEYQSDQYLDVEVSQSLISAIDDAATRMGRTPTQIVVAALAHHTVSTEMRAERGEQ